MPFLWLRRVVLGRCSRKLPKRSPSPFVKTTRAAGLAPILFALGTESNVGPKPEVGPSADEEERIALRQWERRLNNASLSDTEYRSIATALHDAMDRAKAAHLKAEVAITLADDPNEFLTRPTCRGGSRRGRLGVAPGVSSERSLAARSVKASAPKQPRKTQVRRLFADIADHTAQIAHLRARRRALRGESDTGDTRDEVPATQFAHRQALAEARAELTALLGAVSRTAEAMNDC